jgi:uncharacterized protein DUF903
MSNQNGVEIPAQGLPSAPGFPMVSAKRNLVLGIVALCWLTACSNTYVIRLTNSDTITARTKPRLDGHGYYVFKDADGKEVRINELKVREIEAK